MAEPKLVPNPGNNHYVLYEDLPVDVLGQRIWIPSGFHYDGASIPAVAWPVTYTPFAPDVMRAALVHDWLYHAHEDSAEDSEHRATADEILFQLLIADTVSTGKAKLMWMAVRSFGGVAWRNDKEDRDLVRAIYALHRNDPDVAKFGFPSWATASDA